MNRLHINPLPVLLLVLLAGSILTLSACGPTATTEPECLADTLIAPVNLLPNDSTTTPGDMPVLDTLSSVFSWEYEGGCVPEGYEVEVFQPHPDAPVASLSGSVLGSSTALSLDAPLTAGTLYAWRVSAYSGVATGPASELAFFLTGPVCMDPYASEYPTPVLLSPEDEAVITDGTTITFSDGSTTTTISFHMMWDDPAACLPADGYNVEVSDSPAFPADIAHTTVYQMDSRTVMLFFFPPGAVWSECVPYYWRVQADLPGIADGPYSEVRSFMINLHGLDCSAPPTLVPTAPATATHVPLLVTLRQTSICRSGPTLDHSILDYPTEGSSFRAEGRNQDSTWWWIFDERINAYCWVSGKVVDVNGNPGDLPVLTPIAPEVPAPTDTPVVPDPTNIPAVGCLYSNQSQVVCMPCSANLQSQGSCVLP